LIKIKKILVHNVHLEVLTLSSQYNLVSFHFSTILGAKSDIMQETILLIIYLPQVLHQLEGMFLRHKIILSVLAASCLILHRREKHNYALL